MKIHYLAIIAYVVIFQGCGSSNAQLQNSNISKLERQTATPIATAKEFINALINDDKNKIKALSGNSRSMLNFIYRDKKALERAKRLAKTIDSNSWKETKRSNGSIEVTAQAYDSKIGKFPIVFEVMPLNNNGGQKYYISDMH